MANNIVSRITSAGTYFANGKFDEVSYNPTSGGTIGYSTVSQLPKTNLLISSNDYSNDTYWPKNNCSTTFTTATTAPDGTYTAQKFIEDSTTAEHWFYQTTSTSAAGQAITFSFYAKAAERSQLNLRFIGAVNLVFVNINLITGAASSVNTSPNGIGYSVTPAGNGWWRITATGIADQSYILGSLFLIQDSPYTTNYTGNGTSGVYLWGQQLEYGLSASNYVATDLIGPIPRANTQLFQDTQFVSTNWNHDSSSSNAKISLTSATTAPDGSLTAYKFSSNTGTDPNNNGSQLFGQSSGSNQYFTVGTYCTQSMFFKPAEFNTLRIRNNSNGEIFDFVAGTTPVATSGVLRPVLQNVGNGWYRAAWNFVAGSIGGLGARNDNWSYRLASTGDGVSGIYIWGPQLQTGNVLTPYIATSTPNTAINMFTTRTDSQGDVLTIGSFDEVSYVTPSANGLVSGYGQLPINNKNLLPYSQTFNASVWNYTAISANVVNNIILAPDGSTTGTKLVSNTAAVSTYQGIATRQFNQPSAAILTFSIYAKAAEWNYLNVANDPAGKALFNLSTGKVASLSPNFTDAKIINVGNGWYRCITTCTSEMWGSIILQMANTIYLSTMTGDGVSGIYIWGAQLEYGTGVTKYAPNPNKNLFVSTENLTNYATVDIYNQKPWNLSAANTVSTTELDPNGNYTASKFVSTGTNPLITQAVSVTPNTYYTISVSAKGTSVPGIAIVSSNTTPYPNNSTQFSNFDFGAQAHGGAGTTGTFISSYMYRENNGYTRCSITILTDATQNGIQVMYWQGGYGYGSVGNTMTLFGPQLELGNTASPYTANTINLLSSKTLQGGGIEVINEFDEVTWNPPIVTANLTLNLDVANPASYNGGNTWYDTSGRGNHGTLTGNVATSSSNYGLITFDGTSYPNPPYSQISFNTATGSSVGMIGGNFTVEAWVNGANTGVSGQAFPSLCIFQLGGSTPTSGSNYSLYASANYVDCNFYSSGTGYQASISTNTWYQIVQTYNYSTKLISIYTNGTLSSTGTSGTDLNANAANAVVIVGNGFWGGTGWIGSIPVVRVYNKELSQAEINQNYNALAYRYNL